MNPTIEEIDSLLERIRLSIVEEMEAEKYIDIYSLKKKKAHNDYLLAMDSLRSIKQ